MPKRAGSKLPAWAELAVIVRGDNLYKGVEDAFVRQFGVRLGQTRI